MRTSYGYINPSFKQIFPDWLDFKKYLQDYIIYFDKEELTDNKILTYYTLLFRQYANSNIAYDRDIFLDKLSLLIAENFREFFKVKELLELLHSVELDELLLGMESITNIAENPNIQTDKDTIVNYIGTQSRVRSKENIVDRVYTLVDRLRVNEVMIEVYKYMDLFIKIIPRSHYRFYDDSDEYDIEEVRYGKYED